MDDHVAIGFGGYLRGRVWVRAWQLVRTGRVLARRRLHRRHRSWSRTGVRRVVPRALQRRERFKVPRESLCFTHGCVHS